MKSCKIILEVVLGLMICACSTFKPDKQTLSINCDVPNVAVKVNGDKFKCPVKVDVRRDSKVLIEANMAGYEPFSKTIDYHLSTSAKWDAVGTVCWFFPVFGFLSPGAWDLDETEIYVKLLQ